MSMDNYIGRFTPIPAPTTHTQSDDIGKFTPIPGPTIPPQKLDTFRTLWNAATTFIQFTPLGGAIRDAGNVACDAARIANTQGLNQTPLSNLPLPDNLTEHEAYHPNITALVDSFAPLELELPPLSDEINQQRAQGVFDLAMTGVSRTPAGAAGVAMIEITGEGVKGFGLMLEKRDAKKQVVEYEKQYYDPQWRAAASPEERRSGYDKTQELRANFTKKHHAMQEWKQQAPVQVFKSLVKATPVGSVAMDIHDTVVKARDLAPKQTL
jgi:hypothetical protein